MASLADFTTPYDREAIYGPDWLKREPVPEPPAEDEEDEPQAPSLA